MAISPEGPEFRVGGMGLVAGGAMHVLLPSLGRLEGHAESSQGQQAW